MTKSITIRAADSALAMEEVVRQLGPDALILSTARRNGQFEIQAMVEEEAEEQVPQKPALAAKLAKAAFKTKPKAKAAEKPTAEPAAKAQPKAKAKAAPQPDAVAAPASEELGTPVSEVREAAPNTFEALLKRRLEEDKMLAPSGPEGEDDATPEARVEISPEARDAARQKLVEDSEPKAKAAAPAPAPAPAAPKQAAAPAPTPAPEHPAAPSASAQPVAAPETKPEVAKPRKRSAPLKAAPGAARAVPNSKHEPSEPLFARYKVGDNGKASVIEADKAPGANVPKPTHVPQSQFSGLGALEIPMPRLPDHVVETLQSDLRQLDQLGELGGLSKAIVSTLVPRRATEPLGAGRFWLAGPDMRQKALTAMRIAIRKLDAGEAKPTFYVMGREGRADAAFLASKAELLGLSVSLVDESVGRNLPDDVPGSQIVLLPDDSTIAKQYAQKFQHDGDRGLFVLPTVYCQRTLVPLLADWAGMETQLLLCGSEYTSISPDLVACILQFNLQVGWKSSGEEILENLTQLDEATVTDWMRSWVPETQTSSALAPAAAMFRSAQFAAR
ncbi:MAG: hypothetical protein JXR13_17460 [Thalassovita sp.]